MVFERTVYGDPAVKRALLAAQHGKCAYCEIRIASEYGAIDHYRPKGSVRQTRLGPSTSPGYFWLAYTWENLIVACSRCNTVKGDLFPLSDPANRADPARGADFTGEAPLLLDPSREDPELHVHFDAERAMASDAPGRATIEVIALNRGELLEARREHYNVISHYLDLLAAARTGVTVPVQLLSSACRVIAEATQAPGKYAAMVRCLVRERIEAEVDVPCTVEGLMRWATPPASDESELQ